MLRALITSISFFSLTSALSYVCTYNHKDYYGENSLAFQFPIHVIPVKLNPCSTDCTPYEEMKVNGTDMWVGYQSLCTFPPPLEEYDLDEEPEDVKPLVLSLNEGIYVSYPATTICVSRFEPLC